MNKVVAQLSFIEMRNSLPRIEGCIKQLKEIDLDTISKGNEASLLSASLKMENLIIDLFGNDSHQYYEFKKYSKVTFVNINQYSSDQIRGWVEEKIELAIVTLDAINDIFLEKLENSDLLGSSEHVLRAYQGLYLHPEIADATSALFSDGHYSQAIENAVKALNNLVRLRSGILEDGVVLMQQTFSPKKPVLKFNELADESDLNEQKGFMDWFTGTVTGLRNPRAHKIINDEPEMALEYIAFISLLAKLLDKATK